MAGWAFPEGFLFGAATSAHQVEGENRNSDWWEWERRGAAAEPSGAACDHFRRYPQDIALLRRLGLNSYRFSLEWSRIEPQPGRFDDAMLRHYGEMARTCREAGVEPIATLHHFTLPLWLSRQGGVLAPGSEELFARYCGRAVAAIASSVRYIVTINEPMILVLMGYLRGVWPPGERARQRAVRAAGRLQRWHEAAHRTLKAVDPRLQVGVAKHWIDFAPLDPGRPMHRLGAALQDRLFNRRFLDRTRGLADFIGVNYYTRQYATGLFRQVPLSPGDTASTEMGWSICPDGLERALFSLRRYGLPLLVTENGIATRSDAERTRYILTHLHAVRRALGEGVPVFGYQYWSLLDNFEWAEGYRPQFGLVAVDRATQERTPRRSALVYGQIAQSGRLDVDVLS